MNPSQTFSSAPPARLGMALLTFIYLQGLDLLTTVAFLLSGVTEANPIVRWAMEHSASPLLGLAFVKLAAVALGWYCWASNRGTLLLRTNCGYAALIVWNLACLILGLSNKLD